MLDIAPCPAKKPLFRTDDSGWTDAERPAQAGPHHPALPGSDCFQEAARVMAGISLRRLPRMILVATALFCGLLLSGCGGDQYPDNLDFPARTDAIVVNTGQAEPKGFDRPGELPKLILREAPQLREQGAEILDMEMGQDKERLSKLKAEKEPNTERIAELEKTIADWPGLRGQLAGELKKVFGTPAHPKLELEADADSEDESQGAEGGVEAG